MLRACGDAGAAVVPQGGNTGLVGGSVPLHGEIVLDLRRLDVLGPVDGRAGQVTAQAGVTIARLQEHAHAAGWDYGVDLSARDTATVGGTVATNAGGMHVLRYGATRRQLLGVEAVFADGRVMRRLDGLEKDNTGYDLSGLLCGSEGTLAVITAARLRLVPRPTARRGRAAGVRRRRRRARRRGRRCGGSVDSLRAVELFFQDGLDLVCDRLGAARPFPPRAPAFVLVEAAARTDPTDELARRDRRCSPVLPMLRLRSTTVPRRELWRYREGHTEAINLLGRAAQARRHPAGRRARRIPARSARARRSRRARRRRSGCSGTPPTATFT